MTHRKHSKPEHPSTVSNPSATASAAAGLNELLATFGHMKADGIYVSHVDPATSDMKALQFLQTPLHNALVRSITAGDTAAFTKVYTAMEALLGIDMETYMEMAATFIGSDEVVMTSPSEFCFFSKAWAIVLQMFKLNLANSGLLSRMHIDSPLHLIHRIGSWLEDFKGEADHPHIVQLAHDVVAHFLSEIKTHAPAAFALFLVEGIDLPKNFTTMQSIFAKEIATLSK